MSDSNRRRDDGFGTTIFVSGSAGGGLTHSRRQGDAGGTNGETSGGTRLAVVRDLGLGQQSRDKQIGVVHSMLDRVMTAGWLIDGQTRLPFPDREFVPRWS